MQGRYPHQSYGFKHRGVSTEKPHISYTHSIDVFQQSGHPGMLVQLFRSTHLKTLLHLRVTAFTAVLGLLLIIFGYFNAYQHSLQSSVDEIQQSMLAVADTASIAVYTENKELADEALHVLIHNPLICSARMNDNAHSFFRFTGNGNFCHQSKELLVSSPFNQHESIGILHVTINAAVVRDRALKLARLISSMILLVLLGSALTLSIATQRILTQPLTQMAESIHNLLPGSSSRLSVPEIHRHNEFGALVVDINSLLATVESTLTEERHLRMIIHSLQQQYQSIFDHARTGIALIDENGRCILANPAVSHMLGLDFSADGPFCLDQHWLEVVFGDNQYFQELMESALNSGQMITRDIPLYRKTVHPDAPRPAWLNVSVSSHFAEEDPQAQTQENCRLLECVLLDISERKRKEDESKYRAEHDALTQLKNRAAGMAAIDTLLLAANSSPKGAILLIDLDRFKFINDTYGHAAGDTILITTARRMQEISRSIDVVARLGGDEFLVGLFHVESVNHFPKILHRIIEVLTQPVLIAPDVREQVGASIGVALVPQCGTDLTYLMHCADEAMYRVKRAGRCGYCIYNGSDYEEPVKVVNNG